MSKYENFIKIIDSIRYQAPEHYKIYYPVLSDEEKLNYARSRAFIHLFLQVKFGLLDFIEREKHITDGTYDAGIDSYYIDRNARNIYFIQAKFRASSTSFESREIKYEEIISMETERIMDGELQDERGYKYNGKILDLIKELNNIQDIGRYNIEVIILANVRETKLSQLKKLTGGLNCVVYDFEKCYSDLVFPVVSGTYYSAAELFIEIDINNKSAAGEITYSVETEHENCDITVVFVPTIEIAKILDKYKNSILKFNPRSYLDLASGSVNSAIAKTITDRSTNEFALFNNGITMLSDGTTVNKKLGQKGKAQLIVTNPQIINGGQTAYTLSRIYSDPPSVKTIEELFDDKEVLLKVISFNDSSKNPDSKLKLIEDISKATNQQTPVSDADRRSNDKVQIELQQKIFNKFGYYYERKKGEFGDGIRNNYLSRNKIIDRELFIRICSAIEGNPANARRSSAKQLFSKDFFNRILPNSNKYEIYIYGYQCYQILNSIQNSFSKVKKNQYGVLNYGNSLLFGKFSVIYVCMKLVKVASLTPDTYTQTLEEIIMKVLDQWLKFEAKVIKLPYNERYFKETFDQKTGERTRTLNFTSYYKGATINNDLKTFFLIKANNQEI